MNCQLPESVPLGCGAARSAAATARGKHHRYRYYCGCDEQKSRDHLACSPKGRPISAARHSILVSLCMVFAS